MDRFGFNTISTSLKSVERTFLKEGIELAQQEIKENFELESNKEFGKNWNPISYRSVPPPILDLTGQMKEDAIGNKPIISGNEAILTIDPIDERGKGYASYHQEGINQFKDKEEFQREFVTQSKELYEKQESLLVNLLDKSFK